MRYLTYLLVSGMIIAFLLAAGCTGGSSTGTVTPAPTTPQEIPVFTATTPACPAGTTTCPDGSCRNVTIDSRNCGGCGDICPVAFVCHSSRCVNPDTGVVAPPYTPVAAVATPEATQRS
jgi:hypothetical protein